MAEAQERSAAERDSLAELFAGSSNFIERMPMLRVAFDRAAVSCTKTWRHDRGPAATADTAGAREWNAGDLLDAHDGKSVVGVLHAVGWNARLLVCADRDAVFAIVEAMLGGDGSQPPYDADRPLSRIETAIVGTVFERVAKALDVGFEGLAETSFALEPR